MTDPPLRVLSESEAALGTFHDCHVHGLSWRRDQFEFRMNVQYILKWLEPADKTGYYRFEIAESVLIFRNAHGMRVSMDWENSALDAEIDFIKCTRTGTTPNGTPERFFEIEFHDPMAEITLWSTGYEVRLLKEPVITTPPWLPIPDDR